MSMYLKYISFGSFVYRRPIFLCCETSEDGSDDRLIGG
jgi:hypothetical protein